eukprot:328845-Pleurochrysis_carterae.AAC.4
MAPAHPDDSSLHASDARTVRSPLARRIPPLPADLPVLPCKMLAVWHQVRGCMRTTGTASHELASR